MKVLLITEDYFGTNANANCVRNLVKELGKWHSVDVAFFDCNKNQYNNHSEKTMVLKENRFINVTNTIKELLNLSGFLSGLLKSVVYLYKKVLIKFFGEKNFWPYKFDVYTTSAYEKIRKIIIKNNYDCVISVCVPFVSHYLAYKLKMKFPHLKWIAYYLDPYTFNVYNKDNFDINFKLEYRMLKHADNIVIPLKLYEDFCASKMNKYINKFTICEFPVVTEKANKEPNKTINFEQNTVNCVFVGYLYPEIRSPEFFIDLISKSNKNIKFYIVGGVYNTSVELNLDNYKQKLGDRLIINDSVQTDEAFRIMNDADILVNIGNTVSNQLPSKIFDYISTGKPIVNTYKNQDCPTLGYMAKYPFSINFFEKNEITDNVVKEFETFCYKYKGKKLEFNKVKDIFITSTPEYVSKQFDDLVRYI